MAPTNASPAASRWRAHLAANARSAVTAGSQAASTASAATCSAPTSPLPTSSRGSSPARLRTPLSPVSLLQHSLSLGCTILRLHSARRVPDDFARHGVWRGRRLPYFFGSMFFNII